MMKSLFTRGAFAAPQFRWFYMGRTISLLGSGMTPVALAFAILQAHHGQQLLGYIMTAEILPHIVMLLIGGSVADRYRRDRLIQLASVGAGCAQAGIAAIVLTGGNPYGLFPLAVLNGVIGAFTAPATRGIIPELVHREAVQQANAYLATSRSVAKIVGPALAGILAATVGGGWSIAMDSLSFLVAAAFLTRVKTPSHPAPSQRSLLHEMREGWTYFVRRPWIWSITMAFTVMNPVQMGAWRVLGPIIAKHSVGAAGWGLILSLQAVGLLAASLLMMRLHFARPLRAAMMGAVLVGLPMFALGLGLSFPWLMASAAAAGMGSTVSGIAWSTSLQQGVPKDKLSRVMAFDDFGSFVAIPLGLVAAVPVAERFGFRTIEALGGLVWMLVALLPLSLRGVRQMTVTDIQAQGVECQDTLLG